MKALCIGQSSYNFSVLVDNLPQEGNEVTFTDVTDCGSGSATNVAYMLGKYGLDSYLSSVIGDDTYGNNIKKELEAVGVHTEYMEFAYEKRTPISLCMINKNTKVKTITNIVKDNLVLKKNDYTMDPDIIYVDGTDYGASLVALNRFANKITVLGAKKCNKDVLELCKYCNYIIATKEFAEWVTGMIIDFNNVNSLVTVYSTLINKFINKNVIVTLGSQGALYMADNQIKVMPGLNMEVMDTTGAGDFFRGAYIYALTLNYDVERAVTFANIASCLSATKMGTRACVPDMSDILTYFEQKYPKQAPAQESPAVNSQAPNALDAPSEPVNPPAPAVESTPNVSNQ